MAITIKTTNLHEFGPQALDCVETIDDQTDDPLLDEFGSSICAESNVKKAGLVFLINLGDSDTFEIPLREFDELGTTSMLYNFVVDWGDNTTDTITAYNDVERAHQYTVGGNYIVRITGTCQRIAFGWYSGVNADYLLEVQQWDNIVFKDMAYAFYDCTNMTITATDIPDVSAVTDFEQAFDTCHSLVDGLAGWDVTAVLSYKWCFYECLALDQDFSSWDVSNTPSFFSMFENSNFDNASLANWDMSGATDLEGMFWGTPFNQDITNWDVSNVTTMEDMFHLSDGFNTSLAGWDVSSCTNFIDMFSNSVFNASLAGWTFGTGSLFFNDMFSSCPFNQPLASWDGASANIRGVVFMFDGNTAFNQDISGWTLSNIISFEKILRGATGFSTANYDLLLNGWAAQGTGVPFAKTFDCASTYTIATSQTARDYLDITRAWTMTDLGGI